MLVSGCVYISTTNYSPIIVVALYKDRLVCIVKMTACTYAHTLAFLSSLHSQTEEQALAQLLAHLPLLNPGSTDARGEYMKLLPKVMLGSSEELDYLDQCRQLLSLALVHPAFPQEDREALTFWLSQLDRKQKNIVDRKAPSPSQPSRIYQIKSTPEEISWNTSSGLSSGRINISGELNMVGENDGFTESNHIAEDDEIKCNSLPPGQSLYNSPSTVERTDRPPPASYDEFTALGAKSNSIPMSCMVSVGSLTATGTMGLNSLEEGGAPGQQIDWMDGMKGKSFWNDRCVCIHIVVSPLIIHTS